MGYKAIISVLIFGYFFLIAQPAYSIPFLPKTDGQVLEQLNLTQADRLARKNRISLQKNPFNLPQAILLAKQYIEESRIKADPRYLGYAEAVLAPWWHMMQPPVEVLVLRATILQSLHKFNPALTDLENVLKRDPNNAQAWLTRAIILQVQGHYAKAKSSCFPIITLASPLTSTLCMASIDSVSGYAPSSYALIERILQESPTAALLEKAWAYTLLGEIAGRLGHAQAADHNFKVALALTPDDSYLKAAYADFLIDQDRPREVIPLLEHDYRNDLLLLRQAIAEKMLGLPIVDQHIQILKQRFAANRLRGDTSHQREEAIFELKLLGNAQTALRLAESNWNVQREPWDARIFLEAAIAAHNPDKANMIIHWLKEKHLQDVNIKKLIR